MSEFQNVPLSPIEAVPEYPYAGFWWRFLACVIDTVILQTVISQTVLSQIFLRITDFTLGLVLRPFVLAVLDRGISNPEVIEFCAWWIGFVIAFVIRAIVSWPYSACFESSAWQATIGKKVCGLKVTDLRGNRLSFARATGRYFARYISALTCGVGYIMAAFTEKKQSLHDLMASTLVIRQK